MIEHLQINGFGKLRGAVTPHAGINAFADAAPAGKSTLAALLFYLFYPDESEISVLLPEIRPLSAYAPFAENPAGRPDFSASATLNIPESFLSALSAAPHPAGRDNSSSARRITLWRDFANRRTVLLDAADGRDISGIFFRRAETLGEALFGLTAREFAALALTPQNTLPPGGFFTPLAARVAAALRRDSPERADICERIALFRAVSLRRVGAAQTLEEEIATADDAAQTADDELTALQNAVRNARDACADAAQSLDKVRAERTALNREEFLLTRAKAAELGEQTAESAALAQTVENLQDEAETLRYALEADFSDAASHEEQLAELTRNEREVAARREKADNAAEIYRQHEQRLRADGSATTVTREQLECAENAVATLENLFSRETALSFDLRRAEENLRQARISRGNAEKCADWTEKLTALHERTGKTAAPADATVPAPLTLWEILPQLNAAENALAAAVRRENDRQTHAAMLGKIRARDRYRACRHIGLALALLAGALVASLTLRLGIYSALPLAVCGGWAVYGGVLFRRAENFFATMSRELAELGATIAADREQAVNDLQNRRAEMTNLAQVLETPPEALTAALTEILPHTEVFRAWQENHARLRILRQQKGVAANTICDTLKCPRDHFDLGKARFQLAEIHKTLDLREKTVNAWNAAESARNALAESAAARENLRREILRTLSAALKIPAADADDAAGDIPENARGERVAALIRQYQDTRRAAQRHAEISALLPETAGRLAQLPPLAELTARREKVEKTLTEILSVNPEFAETAADATASLTAEEIASRRADLQITEAALGDPESALRLAETALAERENALTAARTEARKKAENARKFRQRAQDNLAQAEQRLAAFDAAWPEKTARRLNARLPRSLTDWEFGVDAELNLSARRKNTADAVPEKNFPEIFSRRERETLYWYWRAVLNEILLADFSPLHPADETPPPGGHTAAPEYLPWIRIFDEPLGNCGTEIFTAAWEELTRNAAGRENAVISEAADNSAEEFAPQIFAFFSRPERAPAARKLPSE